MNSRSVDKSLREDYVNAEVDLVVVVSTSGRGGAAGG
jgi:hypothetical protein